MSTGHGRGNEVFVGTFSRSITPPFSVFGIALFSCLSSTIPGGPFRLQRALQIARLFLGKLLGKAIKLAIIFSFKELCFDFCSGF